NNHIISALPTASSCCGPACPNQKRLLQKLFRALLRFFAGFHCFVESDSEMQTLIVRPIAYSKIGLGRVDVVKPRGKLFVAAVDPKTVAIVVRSIDISAISQLDPL